MPVVQNLYQIFKIPASVLVAKGCVWNNYSRAQGYKDGNIVSIGDNIVFQQLRYIHGDMRNHHEIFNYVQRLRNSMRRYKKEGKKEEAKILSYKINQVMFVEDVVNVLVDGKKSDFHKFRTHGFTFNGHRYVYLCSGAGQIRRNTATFVREEYHDRLVETINCGLDKKTSEFVLAKYSAYFALAFSSVLWVRTPRCCVIKDFKRNLPKQPVDFICKDAAGKSIIEKREMDVELNCFDGQGLIDPEFAQLWSEDMDLNYTPCSFVARSCFVKGNLATFDFKAYAHEHGITTIKDRWGKEYPIDEIDVLLSESQFKTAKYYDSWDEYLGYANAGNIHWGVARYNRETDDEWVLTNYQYIQSLTLSKEDIKGLIAPTVDWIKKICSGNTLYTLLYCFGPKSESTDYRQMFGTAQTAAMKAIVKNVNFLNDSYIQSKIYKNIAEAINKAKIGKIWVHGNYQFMVSDPLAQCQWALGLEPVGALKANEIYSKFWSDRLPKEQSIVDACRSPLIDQHEHNPMTVVTDNDEANKWYKFMPSGIIYNCYDTSCARHSDSDFDGDIVMTTDNEYFIKGSHKEHNIILYEKGLASPAKMTTANITATVLKGFGTGVGGFSNCATILYSMAAIFDKPGQEEQEATIYNRIKLLREIVGQEIDRIKGAAKPSLPSDWKKYEQVLPDDDEEEKQRKYRHNAMVISKKPYFFRYLYPELNRRYKQFEASYNQVSRDMFGIKFKKLLTKQDKTPEEVALIRKYQKYNPLITSNCTMNVLCKMVESIDFDIRFAKDDSDTKKKAVSMLPTYEGYYGSSFSQDKFNFIKSLYRRYSSRRQIKQLEAIMDNVPANPNSDDFAEIRHNMFDAFLDELRKDLAASGIAGDEFLFYCSRLAPTYGNFNWGFAWDVLGDSILDFIPQGKTLCPVRNKNGIEYLGERYTLEDISNKGELAIQSLFDSIFGDPEGIFTEEEIEEMAKEEGLDIKEEKSDNNLKKETEKATDGKIR